MTNGHIGTPVRPHHLCAHNHSGQLYVNKESMAPDNNREGGEVEMVDTEDANGEIGG